MQRLCGLVLGLTALACVPRITVACSPALSHLPVTDRPELDWSLDVDGNCRVDALTDGLLMIRYQLGLREDRLVDGAVDPAGQRTSWEDIQAYLEQNLCRTDFDDNGTEEPLHDGRLGIRYLLGLRGTPLTEEGAVGTGANRVDPPAIGAYIAFQAAKPCRVLHFSLDYGPYRAGQSPGGERPSTQEMAEDMALMADETDLIRSYGACAAELQEIPGLSNEQGLRLYQGVDLGDDPVHNGQEMSCWAQLAESHENIVAGVVGGEVLLRGDLSEAELVALIQQVAGAGLPVTTADSWLEWCNPAAGVCQSRPDLVAAVDFIVAHSHPYWEGSPIEHAAAAVTAEAIALRALYPDKEIVIGETGWPSDGDLFDAAVPSLENQRRFVEELWAWSRRYAVPLLVFEAFDEAWKIPVEGTVGGHWGLYAEDRVAKHLGLDWSLPESGSGFAAADLGEPPPPPGSAVVSIDYPPGNTILSTKSGCGVPLIGSADTPGEVAVEVYTDAWYPQTLWYPGGRAPVVDGVWSLPEVILAGTGVFNDHRIRIRLYDSQGLEVASDEVQGIVRSNDCTP